MAEKRPKRQHASYITDECIEAMGIVKEKTGIPKSVLAERAIREYLLRHHKDLLD